MSSWKRVLTSDDITSINNTNLGSNDLSQTDLDRTYDMGTTTSLTFEGYSNIFNSTKPLLKLDRQNHVLQLEAIGGVKIGPVNLGGNNHYSLPLGSTCAFNKFLVGFSATESVFKTPNDLFGPSGSVFGGFLNWDGDELAVNAFADSVIVYDGSGGEFSHVPITLLPTRVMYHFGYNASVGTGTQYLKGVNGVQHSATVGFVATRNLRLLGCSLGYTKSSGGSHRKRLRIYRNGTQVAQTDDFGASAPIGSFVTGTTNSITALVSTEFNGSVLFEPGDVISVALYTASSYTGSGTNIQASVEFA